MKNRWAIHFASDFNKAPTKLFRVLQANRQNKVAWRHLMTTSEWIESGVSKNLFKILIHGCGAKQKRTQKYSILEYVSILSPLLTQRCAIQRDLEQVLRDGEA